MQKPIHLTGERHGCARFSLFCLFPVDAAVLTWYGLSECPSSFQLQASVNQTKKVYMRRQENVKCAFFGEYKWHVMVHCKHSRLAKSAERPILKWQRGHSLDAFFPSVLVAYPFKGLHRVEDEVGQLENHATGDWVRPALCSSPFTS